MLNTIPIVDSLLNRVSAHRLLIYVLAGLVAVVAVLGAVGTLPTSPQVVVGDLALALGTCIAVNYLISQLLGRTVSWESSAITALILVLIVPLDFPHNVPFFILASIVAIGSKYVITVDRTHIFNPAAVAVAGLSLLHSDFTATWWIGNSTMFPVVLVAGLLLIRKLRREAVVLIFLGVYAALVFSVTAIRDQSAIQAVTTLKFSILNSAVFFFAFVMLTEPITMPPTKRYQYLFAAGVAVLYSTPQLLIPNIVLTPEEALCIGNLAAFATRSKFRLILPIRMKRKLAPGTLALEFAGAGGFNYRPGQFMEWVMPHKGVDSRGTRRHFSLASSPTESNVMIVMKVPDSPSSYKEAVRTSGKNDYVMAGNVSGDFVLPDDPNEKLVLIAGGVGIAPFRSMAKYIIDKRIKCDAVLLYVNRRPEDVLFKDVFEAAERFGLKTHHFLTGVDKLPKGWTGEAGRLTPAGVAKWVSDYHNRTFYLAGPQLMVQSLTGMVHGLGVSRRRIVTDYFPGYPEK